MKSENEPENPPPPSPRDTEYNSKLLNLRITSEIVWGLCSIRLNWFCIRQCLEGFDYIECRGSRRRSVFDSRRRYELLVGRVASRTFAAKAGYRFGDFWRVRQGVQQFVPEPWVAPFHVGVHGQVGLQFRI